MSIPERLKKSVQGLDEMCRHLTLSSTYKPPAGRSAFSDDWPVIVEVGAWTGIGTQVFAKHFKKVYAVDPWSSEEQGIAQFYNMRVVEGIFDSRHASNPRVVKVKKRSTEAARDFEDGTIDVVYIDAVHTYEKVKEDIDAWLPKVRAGGFLCGHDYTGKFPGVVRAVKELQEKATIFPDTSWVVRVC